MSDTEVTPKAPRRSTRARKSIVRPTNADPGRRKLADGVDGTGSESSHHGDDDERDEPEYVAGAPKPAARGRGRRARGGAGGAPPRKRRARANGDGGDDPERDGAKIAKDAKISGDSALFNAILNPGTALQATAEDFLEAVDAAPADALRDLVNFVLRCCGCNSSVDSDQAMDSDGIVDCIDEFTEAFKTETVPSYPLIVRQAGFRKFRKSLAEFFNRVVSAAAELNSLYTSDLIPILQAWVVTMSTSSLRSFRHTATVVALNVETALCEVAASVEKEKETVTRQLEGERKKKRNAERVKELETKSTEVNERRTKLKEYLKEFFDGVFVHRYRDSDPIIRADCVAALGIWSVRYSAHFLEGSNLRYLGWVLSDKATVVRHEAVKSIHGLYSKKDYIVSLHPFTERFKPRLIEMATRDIDLPTRMAVIQLLRTIDDQGLLEDEQREQLCLLVFGTEARIRKAVGGFVNSVWTEAVEGKLVGRRDLTEETPRAQAKVLAELLIKWSKMVDEESRQTNEETQTQTQTQNQTQDESAKEHTKLLLDDPALAIARRDRISLAVESLWDDIDIIRDWQSLLQLLLLDHTTEREAASNQSKKRKASKAKATNNAIEEAWRLEEDEEAVLLQVLLGALKRAFEDSRTKKKQDEEEVTADQISLVLIKSLPQLFTKHQTDEYRIADVLLIPQLMDLGMYLEMRMSNAYESLWDDVTKQFVHYSSPLVVRRAVATIRHMLDTPALANANTKKILELEEELGTALRDVVGTREIETAVLQEEEAKRIEGVALRVACLSSTRDMMTWMEDDEGGKQSRALDIFLALLERAKLGNEAEDKLNEHAINVASYYLLWKSHVVFAITEVDSPEGHALRQALKQQRDPVVETLTDFVIGEGSVVTDVVKRVAFNAVMSIYLVYCARHSTDKNGLPMPQADLQINLPEQVQYRFAGYIQAVIEQYAQELETSLDEEKDEGSGSDVDSNDEDGERARKKKRRQPKKVLHEDVDEEDPLDAVHVDPARAIKDYEFQSTIAPFIRAIQTTTISFNHSTVIFTHYGRFQLMYDQMTRLLAEMLREKWHQGDTESTTRIVRKAMEESFELYLSDSVDTEEHAIALAKLLASHFSIRGAHLAVQARLASQYVSQTLIGLSSWLVQKLGAASRKRDKEMIKKISTLFRAPVQLVVGLEPTDALKLKALLEQSLSEAEVVPSHGKQWEGLRAFEKRLAAAVSKDKNIGPAKKSRRKRGADAATDEEGDADNIINGGISGTDSEGPHRPPPTRTRPMRTRAAKDKAPTATSSSENDEEEESEDVFGAKRAMRARPAPARKSRTQQPAEEAREDKELDAGAMDVDPAEELEPDDSVLVVPNGSPVVTPSRGRKRPRPEENEPENNAGDEGDESNDVSKFPRRKYKKVKL